MEPRMPFDDVAWEKSDNIARSWIRKVLEDDSLIALGHKVAKHRGGKPIEVQTPPAGSFNVIIATVFEDGGKALIRLAKPAVSMFPEEKTRLEVATMRFVQAQTTIPVPLILEWGTKEESPCDLGPFIIMEWVENDMDLCDALKDPNLPEGNRPVLDPAIPDEKLRKIYRQLAEILVQLSRPSAERIGAISQVGDEWEVDQRPLTFGMAELVQLGTVPRSKAPSGTFSSSTSYFRFLADLLLEHLVHQRNDAVKGEDDCRRKYVARQLFRKLAREDRLAWKTKPPFRLWSDDFRPANVLASKDLAVRGVIDWEWMYFAPPEFSNSPPWWLLIEMPEYWQEGLEDWADNYEKRLETFLEELKTVENEFVSHSQLEEGNYLSDRMRKCWDDGDFWVFYALRKSFAFDAIFWHKICPRFFGFGVEEWEKGVELLGDELKDMEEVVEKKVKEMETRELAWDYDGPDFENLNENEKEEEEENSTVSRAEFDALRKEHDALKQEHELLKARVDRLFSHLGLEQDQDKQSNTAGG
ncbi:phosphotransferase family protein [Phyllosticta citriasiana]|uniref:phosphotransferase family protein n=1 Tax=Phyllosticta citriasiana TaxID=595635 RepID=UPI0030FD7F59